MNFLASRMLWLFDERNLLEKKLIAYEKEKHWYETVLTGQKMTKSSINTSLRNLQVDHKKKELWRTVKETPTEIPFPLGKFPLTFFYRARDPLYLTVWNKKRRMFCMFGQFKPS